MSDTTLGQCIAAAREKAGLSQRALAKAAEISQPTLANIETDARDVKFSTVQRIAAALGMPLWKLVKPL